MQRIVGKDGGSFESSLRRVEVALCLVDSRKLTMGVRAVRPAFEILHEVPCRRRIITPLLLDFCLLPVNIHGSGFQLQDPVISCNGLGQPLLAAAQFRKFCLCFERLLAVRLNLGPHVDNATGALIVRFEDIAVCFQHEAAGLGKAVAVSQGIRNGSAGRPGVTVKVV